MIVRDGMSAMVLTVGPGHTLRQAAKAMVDKRVGAAIVSDPEAPGPAIITERDILNAVGRHQNVDDELVSAHLTSNIVVAGPDWSLMTARPRLGVEDVPPDRGLNGQNHKLVDITRA